VVLAVKHNAGHGVVFGMAESYNGGSYAAFVGKFLRRPGKYEKRFAARLIADADVPPNPSLADRIGWHSHIF
jgi:hypothetical protein